MRMPLSLFLPKTSGWPCSSAIVWSSRTSFSVRLSQAPSLKMLQFCRISTKAVPWWAAALLERRLQVRLEDVHRARDERGLGAERERERVERPVDRAVRRRLRLLADLGRRRVLALGQAVDLVVEEQDLQAHVAAQHVDRVVAADRERVAVAGGDPDLEVGPRDLEAGGDRRRAAVDGVEAVGVHVVREAAGAADARDDHELLARDARARGTPTAPRTGSRSRRSPGTSGPPGRSGSPSSCRPAGSRSLDRSSTSSILASISDCLNGLPWTLL